jgi:predicted O-methyltransferase YrrM
MLLATTNQICQNVAVVPFLWILPLTLYLLSFIIAFGDARWYDRRVWTALLISSLAGSVYLLHPYQVHIFLQIATFSATLFSACMICHGELVRLKPSTQHLTAFYVMIALGGALGGVFVTLLAPVLFPDYWEFHLGLVATYGLFALCVFAYGRQRPALPRWVLGAWSVSMLGLLLGLGSAAYEKSDDAIATHRSFYGVWRVTEFDHGTQFWRRELYHGVVRHGSQWMNPQYRHHATAYFGPDSGVALAIEHHPKRLTHATGALPGAGLHVGIVGLGAGTIAVHGPAGDRFRFYEIDREVVTLTKKYFYFLRESAAEVQIVLGDARITLARELENGGSQQFDILVIDAFSGDAPPTHLLTREAFDLYWTHLTPDGILAVNITNQHLDLSPVVRTPAEERGKQAIFIHNSPRQRDGIDQARWILVTDNQAFLTSESMRAHVTPWPADAIPHVAWRDDYSNLLDLIKHPWK